MLEEQHVRNLLILTLFFVSVWAVRVLTGTPPVRSGVTRLPLWLGWARSRYFR